MLPKFALRRPVTILMGFVCAVVLGLMSSQWLPLAKFPEVEFPGLYISMPYQGSTPAEIERLITRPAEDVLGTVSKVKRMSTFSRENEVGIQMSFDWGEDIGIKVAEVREKLDSIRDDLPTDFQRYYVYTMSTADEELLEYRISSKRNLKTSYDLLDRRLKRRIERLEGVSKVELYGVQKRQLRVELSSARMAAHRIDPGALFNTLQNANFAVGAGRITDGGRRLSVQPIGDLTSPEDLENVIVGEGPVRLKDVATVSYKRPKLYEGRHLDREFAIGIDVFKASGYNTVAVADRVNEEIREIGLDPQLEGIELIVTDDQAA
ncbi:MAG: efflux RND transporter permease subunit, partial [Bacteroidota bacterium]